MADPTIKVDEATYAKMSAADRLRYARGFRQSEVQSSNGIAEIDQQIARLAALREQLAKGK